MDAMKSLNIELTADYMVMAALLADLKSRLLLPKPKNIELEKDPKQQLIDRLETYLRIKKAAEHLGQFSVLERDTFNINVNLGQSTAVYEGYSVDLLKDALFCVFNRPEPVVHQVQQEPVLLEERIAYIELMLESGKVLNFSTLLKPSQGKMGMVVTFMAILELTRQQKVQIVATGIEAPLAIQGVAA
jgi:segregation and condensation protein A